MTKINLPSKEECLNLLTEYKTPERPKKHSLMVAKVGIIIGEGLNRKVQDLSLNIDLIEAAGLLHDMLRVEENHGEKCAEIMEKKGYKELAFLVGNHMTYKFNHRNVDEKSIFCLADRLVLEDQFVDVDQRMDYVLKKYIGNMEAEKAIQNAKTQIKEYIEFLEKEHLGEELEKLVKQALAQEKIER